MGTELVINPKTIYSELQKQKPQIEAALPKHMTPDRMARLAYTQLRVNPKLFACTFESFMGCIMGAAQLGLEPGVNGQCYLIPYEDRKRGITVCTLVPGWKGLIDLVSRSARASAWTNAVRKGDTFTYRLGSSPRLEHEPGDEDTGNFTHIYAVGWVKDAQWPILEVWSRAKVLKHLHQYNKVGDRHYALANENNLEMYGRKCALLQVIKYLPTSIELRDAVTLDANALEGKQNLTIDGVLTSGGLVPDGPDEQAVEAEGLMEQLAWPADKREMFRNNYAAKIADGLAYLKSEIQRASRGNGGNAAPPPAASSAPAPQEQQEAPPPAQATHRRTRGRGAQQAAPAAQGAASEEDTGTEGSPQETPTDSSSTQMSSQGTASTEPPAQRSWF